MRISLCSSHHALPLLPLLALALAACTKDSTSPTVGPDALQLTTAQVKSLDSTGQVIVTANPGRGDLQSLVDSTLLVLTAGVQAKRIDVVTDLTTKPLYFVGVHRVVAQGTGAFSTWTLLGLVDPSQLGNVIEVSGFAQSANGAAPTGITGTIGDRTGVVNALLLQVGTGGAITEWSASTGSVSFSSDAPGAACPGFTGPTAITCAIETMYVHFVATAASGTGGASGRQATIASDVDVPTMRLTYTP